MSPPLSSRLRLGPPLCFCPLTGVCDASLAILKGVRGQASRVDRRQPMTSIPIIVAKSRRADIGRHLCDELLLATSGTSILRSNSASCQLGVSSPGENVQLARSSSVSRWACCSCDDYDDNDDNDDEQQDDQAIIRRDDVHRESHQAKQEW